jgi:murein DD-endopeptidase
MSERVKCGKTRAQRTLELAAVTLLFISAIHARGQIPASVGVAIDVPVAPTPITADGNAYLVYELHITNFRNDSLELRQLEVLTDPAGASLASFNAADLQGMLARPGISVSDSNSRIIAGGYRAVVFLTIVVTTASTPTGLRHRLFFAAARENGGDFILEAARVSVQRDAPLVINAPLRGAGWVAGNILTNSSDHRRAILPVDGYAGIAQRYAIDWMKIDVGKLFQTDPRMNVNWYGYGAEILAVANGTVAEAKDDAPDNVFAAGPDNVFSVRPKQTNNMLGNYIALEVDKAHFAVYAHVQPGSIKVKAGQHVRQGQVLALLGNSGNSPFPHLHFHVVNRPPFGEGVPYLFDSFVLQGRAQSLDSLMPGGGVQPHDGRDRRSKEMPANYAVVNFESAAK